MEELQKAARDQPQCDEHHSPTAGEALPAKRAHSHVGRSCLSCLQLPVQGSCCVSISDQVPAELFVFCITLRLPLPFHFSNFGLSTQH